MKIHNNQNNLLKIENLYMKYKKKDEKYVLENLNFSIQKKIMNPGVVLDDDFVINTTSDALFDSRKNVLDNIIRSLIIEKSQDYFYYENDDGTYSLIKNETNFVFDLMWENKHYHFATFKDVTNYLYEIIKNKAIKVGI